MNYKRTCLFKLFIMLTLLTPTMGELRKKILKNDSNLNLHCLQLLYSIVNLVSKTFPEAQRVTLLYTENNEHFELFLQQLTVKMDVSLLIINTNTEFQCTNTINEYQAQDDDITIVFAQSVQTLKYITRYGSTRCMNQRAKILIIQSFLSVEREPERIILEDLWQVQILKATVLSTEICAQVGEKSYQEKLNKNILLTSYNPFINVYCSENTTLESMSDASYILTEGTSSMKVANLYGYTIRAAGVYVKYPPLFSFWKADDNYDKADGYFNDMFQTLRKYMNFSLGLSKIHDPFQYGHQLENGSWTGVMGSLVRKEVDIAYSTVGYVAQRCQVIDCTDNFMSMRLSIVVPTGQEIPPAQALLMIYDLQSWCFIIAALCSIVLVQRLLHKWFEFVGEKGRNICEIFLNMFRMNLHQSSTAKPMTIPLRIILFIWLYYCLVIGSIFQGAIVSMLTSPHYYPDLNTLEELSASDLKPKGLRIFQNYFNDSSSRVLWPLFKRYETNGDFNKLIENLTRHRQIAVAGTRDIIEYYGRKFQVCPGYKSNLHIMKEILGIFHVGMGVPQGSPFHPRINVLLGRIKDAGLILKWLADEMRTGKDEAVRDNSCDGMVRPISLEDMEGALYVECLGSLLAIIICVAEIIQNMMFKYLSQQRILKKC